MKGGLTNHSPSENHSNQSSDKEPTLPHYQKILMHPTSKLEQFFINFGLLTLIWLSTLDFGMLTASIETDASWTQALGYAFKHHFQAGVDYIFTFGPFGYLSHTSSSYDADLFSSYVSWQFLSAGCFSFLFFAWSYQLDRKIDKFVYFFLIIVVVSVLHYDAIYILGILASTLLAIRLLPQATQSVDPFLMLMGLLLCLALAALTKFPHLVLASLSILTLTMVAWRTHSRGLAITVSVAFTIFLLGGWLVSGQSLLNFPLFLKNSWDMASAYNEAMAGGINHTELKLATVVMSALLGMLMLSDWVKPLKLEKLVIAGLLLSGLFLAWKEGFVRHDSHSMIFFIVVAVLPFFISVEKSHSLLWQYAFSTLRYVTVFVSLSGLLMAGNVLGYNLRTFIAEWNYRIIDNYTVLTTFSTIKNTQDTNVAILKQQHDLPNIRAQVGSATVDMFGWEQGVLFLNGFNWHPRPIFQSYAAYTSSLLAINGDFYANNNAPQFVIFKFQDIDNRLPMTGDTEVLKLLLRDYQPVLTEKDYLLLKRIPRGQGRVADGDTLLTRQTQIGESLDIQSWNQKPLLLSLDIRKSWLGHVVAVLYRVPIVNLEIETTDGTKLLYRIIPNIVQTSFVINPLLLNQEDVHNWYAGSELRQIAKVRVVVNPEWLQTFFQPDLTVKLSESPLTPPTFEETIQQQTLPGLYPMLHSQPYQVSSPHQEMLEGGESVLMVHVPGELRFQVPAGKHTLMGQFGIHSGAYNKVPDGCQFATDGVDFEILQKEPNKPEVTLFKRFLNPVEVTQDRGMQTLPEIAFVVEKSATVLFLTHPGPAQDAKCDWSFWKEIRIE